MWSLGSRKDWGLSRFGSSQGFKMLRGLNFFVFQAGLPRLPKDWVIRVFWSLPAFLHLNPKNIEASPGFGAPSVPKY